MDSMKGAKKEISYFTQVICQTCNGTGSKDGKASNCNSCGGSGVVSALLINPSLILKKIIKRIPHKEDFSLLKQPVELVTDLEKK